MMTGGLSWPVKLLIGAIVALTIVTVAYLGYSRLVVNPRVADELRSNPQGQRAARVLLLTFADGSWIPVNYLQEGERIFIGADGLWWREFRGNGAPVSMLVRGEILAGQAVVVLDNPTYTEDVFSRLRPTVPDWLPDWLSGKLVVVTIVREP